MKKEINKDFKKIVLQNCHDRDIEVSGNIGDIAFNREHLDLFGDKKYQIGIMRNHLFYDNYLKYYRHGQYLDFFIKRDNIIINQCMLININAYERGLRFGGSIFICSGVFNFLYIIIKKVTRYDMLDFD